MLSGIWLILFKPGNKKKEQLANYTVRQVIEKLNRFARNQKPLLAASLISTFSTLLVIFNLADHYFSTNPTSMSGSWLLLICSLSVNLWIVRLNVKRDLLTSYLVFWFNQFVRKEGAASLGPMLDLLESGFFRKGKAPLECEISSQLKASFCLATTDEANSLTDHHIEVLKTLANPSQLLLKTDETSKFTGLLWSSLIHKRDAKLLLHKLQITVQEEARRSVLTTGGNKSVISQLRRSFLRTFEGEIWQMTLPAILPLIMMLLLDCKPSQTQSHYVLALFLMLPILVLSYTVSKSSFESRRARNLMLQISQSGTTDLESLRGIGGTETTYQEQQLWMLGIIEIISTFTANQTQIKSGESVWYFNNLLLKSIDSDMGEKFGMQFTFKILECLGVIGDRATLNILERKRDRPLDCAYLYQLNLCIYLIERRLEREMSALLIPSGLTDENLLTPLRAPHVETELLLKANNATTPELQ